MAAEETRRIVPRGDLQGSIGSGEKRWEKAYIGNVGNVYDTVADMLADLELMEGATAITKGYHIAGDGGHGIYNIREKEVSDVDDGGSIIFLDNGNVAELITDGGIANVKQFGAKGDGVTDDVPYIRKAIEYLYRVNPVSNVQAGHYKGGGTVYFPKGNYYINSTLTNTDITHNILFEGEDKRNTIIGLSTRFVELTGDLSGHHNVSFKDISFANRGVEKHRCISIIEPYDSFVNNCNFYNLDFAIVFYLTVNTTVENCLFVSCEHGIVISGNAGVGPSTTLYIKKCWVAHCTDGIIFGFSQNSIHTSYITDTIIEYCDTPLNFQGNANAVSKITVSNIHFEGNTNHAIVRYASINVENCGYDVTDGWSITADTYTDIYIKDVDSLNRVAMANGYTKGKIRIYADDGNIIDTVEKKCVFMNTKSYPGFQLFGSGYHDIEYFSNDYYAHGYGNLIIGSSFAITALAGAIATNAQGTISITDANMTKSKLIIRGC